MSIINNLIQQAEAITEERETNVIVAFISKMVELFPKIREVQPTIEKVGFGMGTWCFYGHAIGVYKDEDDEEAILDDYSFSRYIRDDEGYCAIVEINRECIEFVELADYFVNTSYLNASTLIDYISDEGVVFEREENPKSVFGHPPLSRLYDSMLYKKLIEAGVKIKVILL